MGLSFAFWDKQSYLSCLGLLVGLLCPHCLPLWSASDGAFAEVQWGLGNRTVRAAVASAMCSGPQGQAAFLSVVGKSPGVLLALEPWVHSALNVTL